MIVALAIVALLAGSARAAEAEAEAAAEAQADAELQYIDSPLPVPLVMQALEGAAGAAFVAADFPVISLHHVKTTLQDDVYQVRVCRHTRNRRRFFVSCRSH